MLLRSTAFAMVMLLLTAVTASAGSVTGRLYMTSRAQAADSAGRSGALRQLQAGVSDAVVSIEPAPAKLEKKLKHKAAHSHFTPRIDQAHMQFSPRVMVVAAGDSIQFTNLDTLYHNVFSVSTARHFDVGRMPPGSADTVRFDRPGVINLHCELHPEMIGYIVVLPTRVFARPDSLGTFELPKLPRGHYTLRAWHPRGGAVAREFDVPNHGDTRLSLTF
jgi:plastocyanin